MGVLWGGVWGVCGKKRRYEIVVFKRWKCEIIREICIYGVELRVNLEFVIITLV